MWHQRGSTGRIGRRGIAVLVALVVQPVAELPELVDDGVDPRPGLLQGNAVA
jgi:hypothetical protein